MVDQPMLWHYTDSTGLFGIVTSGKLRFGDARFLNDRTERVYALNLMAEALSSELELGDPHGLIVGIQRMYDGYILPSRLFVCSLSATERSISQWQRYGANGTGYCLGFRATELDAMFEPLASRLRIIYEVGEQQRLLAAAVRREHESFKRRAAPGSPAHYIEVMLAGSMIEHVALGMKHPFFAEEQEWRYVAHAKLDADDLTEECCVRGAYIKPYLELPKNEANTEFEQPNEPSPHERIYLVPQIKPSVKLPLEHVICGPKLDSELAMASVSHFLALQGYDSVSVAQSELAAVWRHD